MRVRIDNKGYLSGFQRLAVVGLLLWCCGACTPASDPPGRLEAKTPSQTSVSPRPTELPQERSPENPLFLAEQLASYTRERWSKIPIGVEFNGFHDLVVLGANKEGLRALSSLREERGEAAFQASVLAQITREDSSLRRDIEVIRTALRKPRVTAPLDLFISGEVKSEEAQSFEEALRTLQLLPDLARQLETEEERVDGSLFALKLGRVLARDATLELHYLDGLEIQEKALEYLSSWIESRKGTPESLRAVIVSLQMRVSSPQELEWIWDTFYLLSEAHLKAESQDSPSLEREKLALAVRYLKVREYIADERPPAQGYRLPQNLPELKASVWVQAQPDFLPTLERSRRASAHLAAVELKAALELYRLERKAYPARLEELVPRYLTRVPKDPLSETEQFEYHCSEKGYSLLSNPPGEGTSLSW